MLRVTYGKRDEPNQLNMMLTCRSGDAVWGTFGANAVHFSFLLEYLAARLGLAVGTLTHVVNNLHAYEDVFNKTYRGALVAGAEPTPNPYEEGTAAPYSIVTHPNSWDRDLALFMEDPAAYGYDNLFFSSVAKPLWYAHMAYRRKDMAAAFELVERCKAQDWRRATREWLERRQQ
jgi:thymidylate synthase